MRRFLEALAETGEVPVPAWAGAAAAEQPDFDEFLVAADAAARLDAPGDAPPFRAEAARWAACTLFRACCCLADRTVDAATVKRALSEPGPTDRTASTCWSVDLFLHHLPQVHELARGLAPDDPLVAELARLGEAWPLSSIGMPAGAGAPLPPECVEDDPCLRRLYVERVLRRGDASHVTVDWLADALRAALGAHADLAPAISAAVAVAKEPARGG